MRAGRLQMPWARPCDVYSAPGSLLFKLRLGEAPAAVPTAFAVQAGLAEAATGTGIGPLDRILRHFGDRVTVTRLHEPSAAGSALAGVRPVFDDLEEAIGLSRTFAVRAPHDCCVEDLVDALRMLHVVEAASPQYVATAPFAAVTAAPAAARPDEARPDAARPDAGWAPRELIGLPRAWAIERGDPTVVVGILDTGVVPGHVELGDNIRHIGPDVVELGSGDLAQGLELLGDSSGRDDRPVDEVGHGTSCAGIIAARGLRLPPGVAPACTVLPARVLGSAYVRPRKVAIGVGRIGDIDRGVKAMVDLGAKVLNMSFGTPVDALDDGDPVPHADVVRYALARGCILVAASGNSGDDTRYTPAVLDGVIAVGAVDDAGAPAAFTTRGAHVALCAPGDRVLSVGLEGYAAVTGTSFAAPFVTGAAALLVARAARRAAALDGRAAARILRDSARAWDRPVPPGHGGGVLDVHAALRRLDRLVDADAAPSRPDETAPLSTGGGRSP